MWDYREVYCESYRRLPIRHGFLFKIPPGMRKNKLGPPDSLEVLAFKTMCILVENVVRNKYATCKVLKRRIHYYYEHFFGNEATIKAGIRDPQPFRRSALTTSWPSL